jgi:hypothetical protein
MQTITTHMPTLHSMKKYANTLTLMTLIFGIVTLLFVSISTLLVFSLLMISIESKTFENAVLRLTGLPS